MITRRNTTMKKLTYISLLLGLVLSACSRDEKNLFSGSAAERLQAEKEATAKQLCDATNGWELLYFPNPEGAGYAFLMEFRADGLAQIAAKNEISCNGHLFDEQESLWNIDFTQSVVLTFDSYNDLFHIFSDPLSDGVGYAGDYEFVVLHRDQDQIKLKGKKYGTYMYLNRLSSSMSWNEYFNLTDAFSWNSFCGSTKKELLYFGDSVAKEITYSNGLMTYTEKNVTYSIPTVISPTGLHCYTSLPNLRNINATDYVFNSDSSRLTCTQNDAIYFTNKMTIGEFFADQLKNKTRFTFLAEQSDITTLGTYKQLVDDLDKQDAQLKRVAYSAFNDSTPILLVDYLVNGKLNQGYMTVSMQLSGDTVSYSNLQATESIRPLLKRFESEAVGIARFAAIFAGTYRIKSNITTINPSQIMLIATNDPTKVLMVNADSKAL